MPSKFNSNCEFLLFPELLGRERISCLFSQTVTEGKVPAVVGGRGGGHPVGGGGLRQGRCLSCQTKTFSQFSHAAWANVSKSLRLRTEV
jgi:hypothetical protein